MGKNTAIRFDKIEVRSGNEVWQYWVGCKVEMSFVGCSVVFVDIDLVKTPGGWDISSALVEVDCTANKYQN